ncbi:MAG: pyridoxamine 5'-phosphate oxidase family protein [Rhizobiaceae bacterium]
MATAAKLNGTLIEFIRAQHVFFVGTAAPDGRVNISPKGLDSLRVLSEAKIVWLNLSGSGNETAAHLRELPRMTLMFCATEGDARILRVYGTAKTTHPDDADWPHLSSLFPQMAGSRQIFELDIDLVQTSCGTGVPVMQFVSERGPTELLPFYENMGEDGVRAYWKRKNVVSIDGKETGIFE